MKKSIMNVFANICAMFVLVIATAGLAMQFATVATAAQEETVVSHEGKATVKGIDMDKGIKAL